MLNARHVQVNVDNVDLRVPVKGLAVGSKTPGRALSKSRSGLRENAVGSHSVHRAVLNNKHTPFRTKTQLHANKPLLDKTPFHNRQNPLSTPTPQTFKIAKLTFEDHLDVPLPGTILLRPSSTRKSLRGRLSASDSAGKSLNALSFQTPVNQGRHWDVSDISIEVPSENSLKEETIEEDYDEIEYMPPKGPEPAYQPPFDFTIPDYKELGLNLRTLSQSYKFDDENQLLHAREFEVSDDMIQSAMPKLKLPELCDDDPFSINRPALGPSRLKIKPVTGRNAEASQSRSAPATTIYKASSIRPPPTRSVPTATVTRTSGVPTSGRCTRPAPPINRPVSAVLRSAIPRSASLISRPVSTVPKVTTAKSSASIKRTVPITSKTTKIATAQKERDLVLVFDVGEVLDEFRFDV